MVARGEGPADRLDQLAGEETAFVQGRRRAEQDGELRPGHARHQPAAPVRLDMALDPPARGLQDRIARRPAERGVDRVIAVHGEQEDDWPLPRCQLLGEPGPRGTPIAQAGQRVAAGGQPLGYVERLRPADNAAAALHLHMMGYPPLPGLAAMGEGGGLAGVEQPVDGVAGGAAAVRIELAEQFHQADPPPVILAETSLPGERRTELDAARAGVPAPGSALPFLPPPDVAACPLGMAPGEEQSMEQLRLGEGADQEMGGAMLVERVQRPGVLA